MAPRDIFFFQAEDGIRDIGVTGVQTCALPICLGHHLPFHLRSLALWRDGLMDGEAERMPDGEMPVLGTGHYVERAIDGQWADGQLQLVGKHEGSTPEYPHVPRERACPFREDDERHAFAQRTACRIAGFLYL